MLPSKSDEELANSFVTYFEDKILTIRKQFQGVPQYQCEPTEAPRLQKFSPMTEDQVALIVKNMKTKSRELDAIPTHILKDMLPVVLPAVTRIVNLSLSEGLFHCDWKMAIVRPVLKKVGLQLINSNYRLVSNLTFISKLMEECMWQQVNTHCLSYNLQPECL